MINIKITRILENEPVKTYSIQNNILLNWIDDEILFPQLNNHSLRGINFSEFEENIANDPLFFGHYIVATRPDLKIINKYATSIVYKYHDSQSLSDIKDNIEQLLNVNEIDEYDINTKYIDELETLSHWLDEVIQNTERSPYDAKYLIELN